ncbi:nitrite reductase small subunit NirD [Proteus mirabilis]|uniref:Nitrite reductase (NADH) small subunit n=1 Tax=Proteus vulgaris TaxID=585 RepID=A0A6G6SKK4_PROVU|nr:nitrite reductase small subunit NirD [Proteus vulgaris]MBG3080541.1 nitrite reductase small subunit NirD [Proteus mirabilis]QIF94331.1 nitrite reductase small subunit NirD [Proteus vulgaris]WIF70461.1 nitrite reductase small subunit NirD [Proteus vulgaris]CRL59958.1 Nitrite reductase (NADH) small subunit [Proteus vulgaris]SUC01236.1 nitrite reductase small subunit [Proteus vulgaris]
MSQWIAVCQLDDITPGTGVCALVEQDHVAIFRPYSDARLYALSNIDPFAHSSVLSRGLIAEHENELYIVSPLKKQHFRLTDGFCLEDERFSITHFDVKVEGNTVSVRGRNKSSQ